ncbi:hypothetical protein DPMN_095730 [Dreissena polymorpha]|uniref:Uncharacterized protein n=1 Tax=Dreissena polymorpha TaxID=45954 RepID=A0A9D4L7G7_DREPO|nr:hypothetical protein DPMN_095730 [Dreissena polymorpha]
MVLLWSNHSIAGLLRFPDSLQCPTQMVMVGTGRNWSGASQRGVYRFVVELVLERAGAERLTAKSCLTIRSMHVATAPVPLMLRWRPSFLSISRTIPVI